MNGRYLWETINKFLTRRERAQERCRCGEATITTKNKQNIIIIINIITAGVPDNKISSSSSYVPRRFFSLSRSSDLNIYVNTFSRLHDAERNYYY